VNVFDFILERGVFAVIRLDDLSAALPLAEALAAGGVRGVEFTLTNRDALGAVERVRARLRERAAVGIGTVTDATGKVVGYNYTTTSALTSGAKETVNFTIYADPSLDPATLQINVIARASKP